MDEMTIKLPCKIGEMAWCIRNYRGCLHPSEGRICEMYFDSHMQLIINVFHIGRGKWGEKIFRTEEEALEAINRRKNNV